MFKFELHKVPPEPKDMEGSPGYGGVPSIADLRRPKRQILELPLRGRFQPSKGHSSLSQSAVKLCIKDKLTSTDSLIHSFLVGALSV